MGNHFRYGAPTGLNTYWAARPASLSAAFTFSRKRAKAQARQINAAHARGCAKTCTDQGMAEFFSLFTYTMVSPTFAFVSAGEY